MIDAVYKNHVIIDSKVRDVVVHAIFNINIELTPVNIEDSLSIYEMSIEEENRKNSFNSNFFTFEQHSEWFESEIKNNSFFYKVVISENVLIGQIRITSKNVIGITIEKQFRGLGYSDLILKEASSLFFESKINENSIFAYIKSDNIPSIKAFVKGGFEYQEDVVINNIESKKYIKNR